VLSRQFLFDRGGDSLKLRVIFLIFLDLLFLLLSSLAGSFGRIAYYAAFAVSISAGLVFVGKSSQGGLPRLAMTRSAAITSAALFAPTMLVVVLISMLTSYLLSLVGGSHTTDVSGNLIYELARHALIPAVLEEILFRFIPLRLLIPKSRRGAIAVSALLFALIHLNLFQIPYALFAGLVLAFITVASGSILLAVLLHFMNNALSVLWMRNPDIAPEFIISVLLVLSALSALYVIRKRKKYKAELLYALSGARVGFSPELLCMSLVCILVSIINLR